jgi:hypothetical protein
MLDLVSLSGKTLDEGLAGFPLGRVFIMDNVSCVFFPFLSQCLVSSVDGSASGFSLDWSLMRSFVYLARFAVAPLPSSLPKSRRVCVDLDAHAYRTSPARHTRLPRFPNMLRTRSDDGF